VVLRAVCVLVLVDQDVPEPRLLCEEMGGAYELDVPLVVDVRSGPNWEEMQRLEVPVAA